MDGRSRQEKRLFKNFELLPMLSHAIMPYDFSLHNPRGLRRTEATMETGLEARIDAARGRNRSCYIANALARPLKCASIDLGPALAMQLV